MMTEFHCLWCHKPLRSEGSLANMFEIDDCLCDECRWSMRPHPRYQRMQGCGVLSIYEYQGLVRDMLIQYKEKYDEALFPVFLWPYVRLIRFMYRGYTVVPVPSSETREKERGFRTVDRLFSVTGLPIIQAISKTDDVNQKSLSAKDRRQIGSFLRLDEEMIRDIDKILLADDVITTGSTIDACLSLLKGNRRKIRVLCVSHSTKNDKI